MPPEKNKNKPNIFESIFGDLDKFLAESVRQDDLIEVVKTTTETLQKLEARLAKALRETKELSSTELTKLREEVASLGSELERRITDTSGASTASLEKAVADLRSELSRVESQIPEIPDLSDRFNALEKGLSETQNLNGEDIRNYLESLNGEDRLALEAIRGLGEKLDELSNRPSGRGSVARGLHFLIDGVKKGLISNMNFKAGSNMAIAYSKVDGQDTITFNATGGGPGGISVETPTGTVDGSNTSFTVSAEPQWMVADGVTYYDGAGYSYNALTVTMDVPPSASIRAII